MDKGKTVLLVEDDPSHAELIRLSFAESCPETNFVYIGDGQQALRHFSPEEPGNQDDPAMYPDLILLDLRMAVVDGFEVLKQLKSNSELNTIPIVIISTSDAQKDIRQAYQLSANGYVVKPQGFEEFLDLADKVCHYWLGWNQTVSRLH